MFKDYTDEIMNEIIGGANGPVDKAQNAIDFLNEWATYISDFIIMVKKFFEDFLALFA